MTSVHFSAAFIEIRGIVQGVGFRPFIYSLALRNSLTGWVRNTSAGVEIQVAGQQDAINSFIQSIQAEKPPLARIDSLIVRESSPNDDTGFQILASLAVEGEFIPVSPDVAICPDCQAELFYPADRRYHYPFINCTNCGPRFSIIQDIPYDRPKTTMSGFQMCPSCQSEYNNPLDRRFHAQPIACPECGPRVSFFVMEEQLGERDEALVIARAWLRAGKILAIKGLGGYHLACDPTNPEAVKSLRTRKKRSDKPFALMAFDSSSAARHTVINASERSLLESIERPIVLLEKQPDSPIVAEIAPFQNNLGIMLAYTPLHVLLLDPAQDGLDILVMTSGNLSEEPIAYNDEDAKSRLAELADGFLTHDRPIHMRVDDSVVRSFEGNPYFIRRSRGYAPNPIRLPHPIAPLLAAGGELKATFCLTRDEYAFLSHHIGDMENFETLRSYEEGISHYRKLFRIQPRAVACDLHPNYFSTRYAIELAEREQLPIIQVQHHHAHLAACLGDNGWDSQEPVIGLTYDGTGFGTDSAIWGGEILLGGYKDYQRRFHLKYFPLPGGDSAIRNPARIALAALWAAGLDWDPDLPPVEAICEGDRTILRAMLEKKINTPSTSSMGRLFDAVSALIGIRQAATYEGQAAIELEIASDPGEVGEYEIPLKDGIFDPAPLFEALIEEWKVGIQPSILGARFHNSIARVSLRACVEIAHETGSRVVALSGGVWQNTLLLQSTTRLLTDNGFKVLIHHNIPTNDGGISLGQALVAATVVL